LIDEVILVVSPEIGGKGFSVALPEGLRKDLSLLDVREVGEGSVRLHYSVSR
jgi:riboflavin biosynthesis pyrimidine reductase